jgi:translation elongation factor EF-G
MTRHIAETRPSAEEIRALNERDWRVLLINRVDKVEDKLDKVKEEMLSLKVKVALISSLIGSIATIVANKVF